VFFCISNCKKDFSLKNFKKKTKKVNPFKKQTKVRKKMGILYILTHKKPYNKGLLGVF